MILVLISIGMIIAPTLCDQNTYFENVDTQNNERLQIDYYDSEHYVNHEPPTKSQLQQNVNKKLISNRNTPRLLPRTSFESDRNKKNRISNHPEDSLLFLAMQHDSSDPSITAAASEEGIRVTGIRTSPSSALHERAVEASVAVVDVRAITPDTTTSLLGDSIAGEPGIDYPIYYEIPHTSFTCQGKSASSYYADIEARCQVFHLCHGNGYKSSFLCPNGSIFNQRVLVCDWWYGFDCDDVEDILQAVSIETNNQNIQHLDEEYENQHFDSYVFDLNIASSGGNNPKNDEQKVHQTKNRKFSKKNDELNSESKNKNSTSKEIDDSFQNNHNVSKKRS